VPSALRSGITIKKRSTTTGSNKGSTVKKVSIREPSYFDQESNMIEASAYGNDSGFKIDAIKTKKTTKSDKK
jgi:hypothetical protein